MISKLVGFTLIAIFLIVAWAFVFHYVPLDVIGFFCACLVAFTWGALNWRAIAGALVSLACGIVFSIVLLVTHAPWNRKRYLARRKR